jgi:hypothetical protein
MLAHGLTWNSMRRLKIRSRQVQPSAMAHGDCRFDHVHVHAQIDSGPTSGENKLTTLTDPHSIADQKNIHHVIVSTSTSRSRSSKIRLRENFILREFTMKRPMLMFAAVVLFSLIGYGTSKRLPASSKLLAASSKSSFGDRGCANPCAAFRPMVLRLRSEFYSKSVWCSTVRAIRYGFLLPSRLIWSELGAVPT